MPAILELVFMSMLQQQTNIHSGYHEQNFQIQTVIFIHSQNL